MTSLLWNHDTESAPMSLCLSVEQPLESLAAPAVNAVQAGELQTQYPHIYAMIAHIESTKPLHKGGYDTKQEWYEVSHDVLFVLNEVLGLITEGQAPNQKAERAFRRLFSTLQINLFWRITDRKLLKKWFNHIFFKNSNQAYFLLMRLENFLKNISSSQTMTPSQNISIQLHLLNLLAQNFNNQDVQQLMLQGLYNFAFLAAVLPDHHVQKRLSFGGYANEKNFGQRQGIYPAFFEHMRTYMLKAGVSSSHVDQFLNYYMHILRRGRLLYLSLNDFDCNPSPLDHFLSFLNLYLSSNGHHINRSVVIMNNPILLQAAAAFTNHLYTGHNDSAVIMFFSNLHTCQLPENSYSEEAVALWALQALAITQPQATRQSQTMVTNIVTILTGLGVESHHESMANHLLSMMSFLCERRN